jgi:alkylhydroperoxidase family enzyme
MAIISEINPETAPASIQKIIANHLAEGHALTAEKRTLLHNAAAFNAVEAGSYALDDELQRLIGKRAADFYEYAISLQNDCLVCSAYFSRLLEKNHIDFATFDFTDDERLLIEYGRAIARAPKHVPEDLMRLMQQTFTEEQLVVITTMGVFMIANNYFNDILNVDPAPVQE